jgi:hypothetical protein
MSGLTIVGWKMSVRDSRERELELAKLSQSDLHSVHISAKAPRVYFSKTGYIAFLTVYFFGLVWSCTLSYKAKKTESSQDHKTYLKSHKTKK